MKNYLKYTIPFILLLASCELDLTPPDELSVSTVFNDESGLELYSLSFYQYLSDASYIVRGDVKITAADFLVGRSISSYLQSSFNSSSASGWTWTSLRNINYFLQHYQEAEADEATLKSYAALARFFRAWFYYDKVARFGDVPFYNEPLDVDDPDLYKARDSRTLVMDSVLADINYACEYLTSDKDNSCSIITKWTALALKSRICLYEGTYRKYHTELSLDSSVNSWLQQAANAAEELMNSGEYSIYTSSGTESSYRELFVNETPVSDEIILAATCSDELSVYNDANWYWTSSTYGGRYSFTKTFINTYLNIDGSMFTSANGYNSIPFQEEVKNRDTRLQQTIRMGDYEREGTVTPPDFNYTYTGYQPLKFTLDSDDTDGEKKNTNSLPLIRYAEVLLNYAEAKAELDDFTTSDWTNTIALLRERAGITSNSFPTEADSYLQNNYFPEITDPVLLEIRRERAIELCLEGFRYEDLRRWKKGDLLEMKFQGMYVPALDSLLDVNDDGDYDVVFVRETPSETIAGVIYYTIDDENYKLSDGDSGNLILFDNLERSYDNYKYYYPIPEDEILLNPNLVQNDQW